MNNSRTIAKIQETSNPHNFFSKKILSEVSEVSEISEFSESLTAHGAGNF